MSVLSTLLAIPLHVVTSLYAVLATLLPFLPQPRKHHHALLTGDGSSAAIDHALHRYQQLYSTTVPPFYRGSYRQLIDDVKSKLEFALVYLHSDDHDDTLPFCRDTLSDPALHALLTEHHINLYFGPIHHPEPYEVSSLLSATGFPFLALITLNSMQGVTKPTVVYRSEGYVSASTLVTQLRDAVQTHGLFVATIRHERELREAERRVRAMQDEAYQASLARDRDRHRQAEMEAERIQVKEEELARNRSTLLQELRNRKANRAKLRATLADSEPPLDIPNRTQVQFRLPNGTRLRRAFLDTDPVRKLYEYVEAQDPLNEDTDDEDNWVTQRMKRVVMGEGKIGSIINSDEVEQEQEENMGIEEDVDGFKFVLVEPYPRCEHRDVSATIADAGLRNGNVIVEL